MSDKYLGKIVIARTAQGEYNFVGKCISYCDAPTLGINLPNGEQAHWRADLCEVVEMCPEAVDALMAGDRGKP